MKQKWKVTLFVSLSMMMAACGNSSTSSEESSNESTNNAATENVEVKVEGTLDFYTSQPDNDTTISVTVSALHKRYYPADKVSLKIQV